MFVQAIPYERVLSEYEHSKMELCVKLIKLISLAGFGLQIINALFRHPKKTKKDEL